VATGTPDQLRADSDLPTVISFRLPAGTTPADLPELTGPPRRTGAGIRVESRAPVTDTWRLTDWATGRELPLADLAVTPPTLEDVYLTLTGEAGDVG
jgi:ABC-2 type transport system ATP-binding protein